MKVIRIVGHPGEFDDDRMFGTHLREVLRAFRAMVHMDRFVLEYTPDGYDGRGFLRTTPDLACAKRYTAEEALAAWRAVSRTHPVRPDGKPNRPLSAFTVEIVDEEEYR